MQLRQTQLNAMEHNITKKTIIKRNKVIAMKIIIIKNKYGKTTKELVK